MAPSFLESSRAAGFGAGTKGKGNRWRAWVPNPLPTAVALPPVGQTLTADMLRLWATTALARLGQARAQIDALNVFPVPDGDTGTNVYLTFEAAVAGINQVPADAPLSQVAQVMARSALLGARGNSGVILSQQLRGLGQTGITPGTAVDASELADALHEMAQAGYAAVQNPREGTMLTVARDAAAAARRAAEQGADLVGVVIAAADEARAALARTPEQLQILKDNGVVDSGGAAVVVLLDAFAEVATGQSRGALELPQATHVVSTVDYSGPAFEVMYLLDAQDADVERLRASLDGLGDSLVIVGGDGLWNVHVHVDDAGAAVEAALAVGRPHRIRITALQEADVARERQVTNLKRRAVVVAVLGSGSATLLEQGGATPVVPSHGLRPSVQELLDGIATAGAGEIVMLPSDSDVLATAEAAAQEARRQGLRVAVVPTRSIVQSISAVAVHDPNVDFDADVIAMTRTSSATRYAGVTTAVREVQTPAGKCVPGDIIGMVSGDIVHIGKDLVSVAQVLLSRMLVTDAELVTIIAGDGVGDDVVQAISAWLESEHPTAEAITHYGGQPSWSLLMGVE